MALVSRQYNARGSARTGEADALAPSCSLSSLCCVERAMMGVSPPLYYDDNDGDDGLCVFEMRNELDLLTTMRVSCTRRDHCDILHSNIL